jgi:hypothetical protein
MVHQALVARLAEIRRALPPERQEAAVLKARLMDNHLHNVPRMRRVLGCEVPADGCSFRCY